jgi:periplasmic mercuric ion binding protein
MQLSRWMVLASLVGMLAWAGVIQAETKVELTEVHLCCGNCVKTVGNILKDFDGVQGKCDPKKKTVMITARDDKTAQKALDALAKSGFHGRTDNPDLAIKDDSGAKKGKVQSLTVTGIHNCCGNCCKAIKAVVQTVEGVSADTATPKKDTFEVTGNFDAAELVKALNAAGFHVKVKQ